MQRTIRINEESYRIVKELAEERRTSMCKVASAIISHFAEEMKNGVDFGDYTITVRGLSIEAKVALSMLISQIDRIVRSSIRAEEKVEKVEALLYTWIVGNKLPAWWQCERDGEESIEELGEILAEIVEVAHAQARKGGEKKKEVKGDEGKTH
ncbi:MAG: hypothetical protein DRN54_04620 [Thaumarchaeota archaeon]|nr:MAG: hypothetical protein DRN54_04620 [Nitrososphaerota archaeon]